jgi:hypothetical protein
MGIPFRLSRRASAARAGYGLWFFFRRHFGILADSKGCGGFIKLTTFSNEDSSRMDRTADGPEDGGSVCLADVPQTRVGMPASASFCIRHAGTIASALTIVCALVLALDRLAPMRWLFLAWSIANTLWVVYAHKIGSRPLLVSQMVFCGIDAIGMLHYWF